MAKEHDHTYSTIYGKCVVTIAQLDVFISPGPFLGFQKAHTSHRREEPHLRHPSLVLGSANPPSGNPCYRVWDGDEKYTPNTNHNIIWIHSADNWLMYGKPHIYWSNLLGPT